MNTIVLCVLLLLHYLFINRPGESFLDTTEKLAVLRCLQNLSEDEYLATIECCIAGHVLRVNSTVDETLHIDKLRSSRDFKKCARKIIHYWISKNGISQYSKEKE